MSSVFISANEFSNFSWLLLIVSNSFLQLSAFLLIPFLNSFYYITSITRLKKSVSLFFQGNSLDLLTKSGSSASSFLYFSYSVSLGETNLL